MEAKQEFVKALIAVQSGLKPVTKTKMNPYFKAKYATLEDVKAASDKLLADNGFAITQGGVEIGGKSYLRTTLHHKAGYSESFDIPIGEDASNPQKVGSAITYARRYGLSAMLGIVADEDDDGNAAVPAKAPERTYEKVAQPDAPRQAPSAPSTVNAISAPQAKRFYAIAKSNGKSDDEIKAYIKNTCGVERTDHIPRDKYEAACVWAGEKPAEVPF